jgi:hypothetical protein
MTVLIGRLVAQAVQCHEWKINDVAIAAGVVRDAVTTYIHPAFVALLVAADAPVEEMVHATITTLARAFEAGVTYEPTVNAAIVAREQA